MMKRKVSIEDILAVLFQPTPQFEIAHEKSALLLINFLDYKSFFIKKAVSSGLQEIEVSEALNDFDLRAREAMNNAGKLLKTCRDKGFEIVHAKSEATAEKPEHARSAGLNARLVMPSGAETPPFYEAVKPKKGELVFSAPSYDVFSGTKLDFVLRNMGIDRLIVCGLMTDQSVLFSTMQAVNLGFNVIMVEDACTTLIPEAHEVFINWYKTFVSVRTTLEILNLIKNKQ